jgi:predicted unusual protein kinase regulating ubiquinone biosynthesis (AarF/ABC1/UbiB family)
MPDNETEDRERNRLTARAARVARVGANITGAAFTAGAARVFGADEADAKMAQAFAQALGRTKGPLMKVAQMLATVPDLLPEEYAKEFASLQAHAPAMSAGFVRRRMAAELGPDWRARFARFDETAAHAASLGQVHRARLPDGRDVACKLQYPDMASAVEADLSQLKNMLGLFRRLDGSIDPSEMVVEIGDRLREELDYAREAKAMALYQQILTGRDDIIVPDPVPEASSGRLLTMTWLDGEGLRAFLDTGQDTRNAIAEKLFHAWWMPFNTHGVIHGDPHLGNYALTPGGAALNLLDFGCIRIFPPQFVGGVVALHRGLLEGSFDATAAAYERWGFKGLSRELIETLNVWARFIYGPLLDDRVRTVADGVAPSAYGRKEAFAVRTALKKLGPVTIPREFVFMDRAAIGLGSAFLHLKAKVNFHRLFMDSLEGFDETVLAARQAAALEAVGLQEG